MNAPGKKAAVLGLGVSGFESALFLKRKGFEVFASDGGNSPALQEKIEKLKASGIEAEAGTHTLENILNSDWVLISPGIPPASPVYQALQKRKIPVYSEIEAASWFSPASKIAAVTGSSGKTTVSTLLHRVLEKKFGRAFLCGNIGTPWISEIDKLTASDYVVLELSSFQLLHCFKFRPHIGLFLNLSPNHQDWHPDMQDYAAAKLRIFQNQTSGDHAIIRRQDQKNFFPDHPFKARLHYLGETGQENPNEEAVYLAAGLLGCEAALVHDVLKNFEGIEHRLEKVGTWQDISYVNDSKSTTTASLGWALEKFRDQSVILLAGGHPKSDDFGNLRSLLSKKVRKAIAIGEAEPLLQKAWSGACPVDSGGWDFKIAIQKAMEAARPGDTVLLSPACASFDMFKNYQERGQIFKALVRQINTHSTGVIS